MLFGYPIKATEDNWLHDCLVETLCSIHANLRNGETPPTWPDILPEPYRTRLRRRTGLRERLNAYIKALKHLSLEEQEQTLQTLREQNEIACLLTGEAECEMITDLPKGIRTPVTQLFEFAFSLLTDLEIRDAHYSKIYDSVPCHSCPFCGCEYFDAPGAPREALDHYLPKSKYPFAAANLRNLVPMGNKCNSRYKLAEDILRKEDGTRRKSFDPYNFRGIKLSLENSQPFSGKLESTGQLPSWQIDFQPDSEEITTWDEVFRLRERYERDVLDASFFKWLRDFQAWCKSLNVAPNSEQELMNAIQRYASYQDDIGFDNKAFLHAAVFWMLHKHCLQGNQRLIKLIQDIVAGIAETTNQTVP